MYQFLRFFVGILALNLVNSECWDTGCQLDSWAVKGCEQYNMHTTGTKNCPGGKIYSCCKNGSNPPPPPPPPNDNGVKESGICSWYGAEGEIPQGWPTASGEGFDRFAMTAAHKTLPFGTKIRVRNGANGKTVDVRINDRGPFGENRIVDLTYAAFGNIEDRDKGLVRDCSYKII